MLKVTTLGALDGRVALRVDGRLVGPWVAELARACADAAASPAALALNIAGVEFADPAGVALLRALRAEGAALLGASVFLEALLAAPSG